MDDAARKKIEKFECKDRLADMKFNESMDMLELDRDSNVLDIGSGTGIFAFTAAKSANKVVSIEMSDLMIGIQEEKIKDGNIENVEMVKCNFDGEKMPFEDGLFDAVILSTLVHEIEDKEKMFSEIERITKPGARILIVEFKKVKTEYGPPLEERLDENEIREIVGKYSFEEFSFDDDMYNYYRLIYKRK